MGRPAKTVAVISSEKKSHRTKSEIEARKKGEKSVTTGEKMREFESTKARPGAHKAFARVRRLMAVIGRNDAIHEQVMNRYCVMLDEADRLATDIEAIDERLEQIRAARNELENGEDTDAERDMIQLELAAIAQKLKAEAALDKKRSMLLAIEDKQGMTVSGALRMIPKKEPEPEADPMDELLALRMAKEGK